jgi:hypothetical protein
MSTLGRRIALAASSVLYLCVVTFLFIRSRAADLAEYHKVLSQAHRIRAA